LPSWETMAGMNDERSLPARVALFFGWARSPVWYRTPGDVGEVDLETLPITSDLRRRLEAWNAFADKILSDNDFEWPDAQTHAEFTAAGSVLAQELRDQLSIEVIYTPDGDLDTPLPLSAQRREHSDHYGWHAVTPGESGETFRPRQLESQAEELERHERPWTDREGGY
jgi:hypothetical protein